jgi:putative DNA primase/helicase
MATATQTNDGNRTYLDEPFIPFSLTRIDDEHIRIFDGRAEQIIAVDCTAPRLPPDLIGAVMTGVAGDVARNVLDLHRLWGGIVAGATRAGPTDEALQQAYTQAYGPPQPAPVLVRLADVVAAPVQWLWEGRIAVGKTTMLAGDPGLGKSFLTLDMAARISTGMPWPDCPTLPNPAGGVVLLNCEDDLADTIRPRLDRMGADCTRITALAGVRTISGETGQMVERAFSLDRDVPRLEAAIRATPGCRLVIIDPITAYLGDADSHKNAEVRALLAPLGDLAARCGVAVVCVSHLNKGGGGAAIYRTMGSLAFVAAARAAWAVVKDRDDPAGNRRLVLPVKNNLGPDNTGLAYRLIDGAVEWEPDPITMTADDALASSGDGTPGPEPARRTHAVAWLRELLADGEMEVEEIRREAGHAGFAWRMLQRAAGELGVCRQRTAFGGPLTWRLAEAAIRANEAQVPPYTE